MVNFYVWPEIEIDLFLVWHYRVNFYVWHSIVNLLVYGTRVNFWVWEYSLPYQMLAIDYFQFLGFYLVFLCKKIIGSYFRVPPSSLWWNFVVYFRSWTTWHVIKFCFHVIDEMQKTQAEMKQIMRRHSKLFKRNCAFREETPSLAQWYIILLTIFFDLEPFEIPTRWPPYWILKWIPWKWQLSSVSVLHQLDKCGRPLIVPNLAQWYIITLAIFWD